MVAEGPLTAAQIYEQINGGTGTGHLQAAQEATNRLREKLLESGQLVGELAMQIQDGWTGEAGNTAANAAGPLAKASLEDADLLSEADRAVAEQSSAFGTVKHSVVPVSPSKPELTSADVFDAVTTGNWNGYTNKIGEWQAKNQQNIDAFAGYHATSMGNGDSMPSSFTPLVDPGAPVSLADPAAENGAVPKPSGGGLPDGTSGGQPNVIGGGRPSQGGAPHEGPPQAPPPNEQPAPNPQGGTKAAAYQPPPTPSTGPLAPPTQFTPGVPHPNGNSNTGVPAPLGAPFRPGGGFGPGTGGGFGPGTGGLGSGTGSQPGVPGARPGAPGNTPAPGRLVGGAPGEAAPAPRGGTAPGNTGRPGVPSGIPAGGGAPGGTRGEEDKEHRRPDYLLGPDPEQLFGGDTEKPVPPVIGETK